MSKKGIYLAITLLISGHLASCQKDAGAVIHYVAEPYAEQHDTVVYKRKCRRPPALRKRSLSVSCFIATQDNGFRSKSNLIVPRHNSENTAGILVHNGWMFAGTTPKVGGKINPKAKYDEIIIYEYPTLKEDCNRRVYMLIDWIDLEKERSVADDKIYFAIPDALYCDAARLYEPEERKQ